MDKKNKQKLKRLAHTLKSTVIIGHNGLTEAVQAEIGCALNAHELIKIRVNGESKEARKQMIDAICTFQKADLIAEIGHIVTIYRQSLDKK